MRYTEAQYAMMERLSDGVDWDLLSGSEKEILIFLDGEGIAEPRAYVQEGLWVLTQKGEAVLESHRADLQTKEEQAQKEAEQEAKDERQQRFENKISILNLLVPLITFVIGLFVEHFAHIVPAVGAFFGWVWDAVGALF